MRIILTGFDPFGSLSANTSEQIVRSIAERASLASDSSGFRGRDVGGDGLVTEILPTEFRAAAAKIRRLIRTFRPAAVVCLGVAVSRPTICLERIALNLDDEVLPDNAGRVRTGRTIVWDGPLAYQSTLPLQRMAKALEKRGIPAKISNHAGTYVCNHVFYVARHEIECLGDATPCGLIHVPGIRERRRASKAVEEPAGMSLSKMVAAVECCLGILRK